MKSIITLILFMLLMNTLISQEYMTIGEVFDFEFGDKFHLNDDNSSPPSVRRSEIIDKYYSQTGDTLFYVKYINNYEIDYDGTITPFIWIDTVFYKNLGSSIVHYPGWINNDSQMSFYDSTSFISEEYCDTLINGYECLVGDFEPLFYGISYGKGIGQVRDAYSDVSAYIYTAWDYNLFYYRKNGVECGTPDNTIVTIPREKRKPDISFYPNPASSHITLSASNCYIQLTNLSGKLILTTSPGEQEISLEGIPPGLYIATVMEGEKVVGREKLIVK